MTQIRASQSEFLIVDAITQTLLLSRWHFEEIFRTSTPLENCPLHQAAPIALQYYPAWQASRASDFGPPTAVQKHDCLQVLARRPMQIRR